MRTTLLRTGFAVATYLSPMLAVSACGSGPTVSSDEGDATDERSADDDDARSCTREGASSDCNCANGRGGSRTCRDGEYSSCVCDEEDDEDEDEDDSPRTSGQPRCKAGYYTGNFRGKYRPGAFGFGVLPSGFEVDIEGGKSLFDESLPPLAFTLTEETSGPAGEFSTFTVGGGCMQGLATALLITQSPFVAKLTGNLDCETGHFEGELEGYYALIGIPGANFTFRGPLTAEFEIESASLDRGAWMVDEPPSLSGAPQGGGNGTWDAKYTAPRAPAMAMDPCSTIISGGDGGVTMIGPGAPISEGDAGVMMRSLAEPSSLDGGAPAP